MVSMDEKAAIYVFCLQSKLNSMEERLSYMYTHKHPNKMLKETLYISGRVQNCPNNKPPRCSLLKVAESAPSAPLTLSPCPLFPQCMEEEPEEQP